MIGEDTIAMIIPLVVCLVSRLVLLKEDGLVGHCRAFPGLSSHLVGVLLFLFIFYPSF